MVTAVQSASVLATLMSSSLLVSTRSSNASPLVGNGEPLPPSSLTMSEEFSLSCSSHSSLSQLVHSIFSPFLKYVITEAPPLWCIISAEHHSLSQLFFPPVGPFWSRLERAVSNIWESLGCFSRRHSCSLHPATLPCKPNTSVFSDYINHYISA